MEYTQKVQYKNGTVEFYFTFKEDDGFLNYISRLTKLKNEICALSVAVAQNKKTVRIIMPFGTSENDFRSKMNKIFQREYDAFSLFNTSNNLYGKNDYYQEAFNTLFGGMFNK